MAGRGAEVRVAVGGGVAWVPQSHTVSTPILSKGISKEKEMRLLHWAEMSSWPPCSASNSTMMSGSLFTSAHTYTQIFLPYPSRRIMCHYIFIRRMNISQERDMTYNIFYCTSGSRMELSLRMVTIT